MRVITHGGGRFVLDVASLPNNLIPLWLFAFAVYYRHLMDNPQQAEDLFERMKADKSIPTIPLAIYLLTLLSCSCSVAKRVSSLTNNFDFIHIYLSYRDVCKTGKDGQGRRISSVHKKKWLYTIYLLSNYSYER